MTEEKNEENSVEIVDMDPDLKAFLDDEEEAKEAKAKPKAKLRIETPQSIRAGAGLLSSDGFTLLKVTRGDESYAVKLGIRAIPMTMKDSILSESKPVPPRARRNIKPGTQAAEEWGMPQGGPAIIPDFADKAYIAATEKWTEDRAWIYLAAIITTPLEKDDGSPAVTVEDRVAALKSQNLTDNQVQQITSDSILLSAFREKERQAFIEQLSDSGGTES